MNWGKQPLMLLALFCVLLLFSIYQINRTVRTDMATEDYFGEIQNYQKILEAKQRAKKIQPFKAAKVDPFVIVELPAEQVQEQIRGEIFFYCVYNAELDKKIQLVTDAAGQQLIPRSWLPGKAYTIKMSWADGTYEFYDEKNLF